MTRPHNRSYFEQNSDIILGLFSLVLFGTFLFAGYGKSWSMTRPHNRSYFEQNSDMILGLFSLVVFGTLFLPVTENHG